MTFAPNQLAAEERCIRIGFALTWHYRSTHAPLRRELQWPGAIPILYCITNSPDMIFAKGHRH